MSNAVAEKLAGEAEYLLGTIARKKMHGKADGDGFVGLHFDRLASVMGTRKTSPVIQGLIQGGFIVRRKQYTPGVESCKYNFTAETGASDFRYQAATPVINSKYRKAAPKNMRPDRHPVHAHLSRHIAKTRVHDLAGAIKAIEALGVSDDAIGVMRLTVQAMHDGTIGERPAVQMRSDVFTQRSPTRPEASARLFRMVLAR